MYGMGGEIFAFPPLHPPLLNLHQHQRYLSALYQHNMATAATAAALLVLIISIIHTSTHALNILVVGGSGRVGGSTVRWIDTLSSRQKLSTKLTVGGRKRHVRIQSLSTYLNINMVPYFSSSLKSVISRGGKEQSHPIRCRLSSVRY